MQSTRDAKLARLRLLILAGRAAEIETIEAIDAVVSRLKMDLTEKNEEVTK